jgi:hypothetical protein
MDRYGRISYATFGATTLPLVLWAKVTQRAEPDIGAGDGDKFATSVQLGPPLLSAEVRIRGTAAAEALALGSQADLTLSILPAARGGTARTITLAGAVLTAVELQYEQSAMATANLKFVAQSSDGQGNPFGAEDSQ